MTAPQAYEGRCHCGAIGFVFRTAIAPEKWAVRACRCTFCRTHGVVSASDPAGSLQFVEHVPHMLHAYRFGHKTADFLICRNCGAYIGARMQSGSRRFGIVNVRVLPSLAERLSEPAHLDPDRVPGAERHARRESRWTPVSSA
jgi:hypothetical protein